MTEKYKLVEWNKEVSMIKSVTNIPKYFYILGKDEPVSHATASVLFQLSP